MYVNSWFESYGDRFFGPYDMSELNRDECFLSLNNTAFPEVVLYERNEECFECDFSAIHTFGQGSGNIKLNTAYTKFYKLDTGGQSFELAQTTFGEFGVYEISVNEDSYQMRVLKDPVNIYFPLLTVFLIYAAVFLLIPICKIIWRKIVGVPEEKETKKQGRVKALDTFRGISIVLMIFVNYGHGGYTKMGHAVWNGLWLGDLPFPWFMWIMGACIPISLTVLTRKAIPKKTIFFNILKRSCILFALGLFLQSGPNFETFRVFGVLQRFSIAYLTVASLELLFLNDKRENSEVKRFFNHVLQIKLQIIFALILLAFLLCTYLIIVPGCPRGYAGPGGKHEHGAYWNCTGGAAGYIDNLILGDHIYQYMSIRDIYDSQSFDPEGILGCLSSIYQVFLGVQAGTVILQYKSHKKRLLIWMIWAVVTGLIGGGLCGFQKETGLVPLNKNLWSISYVMVTTSLAFVLLSICYVLIDVSKWWTGKPFLFAGMNSIILYVGHSMVQSNFPIHWYLTDEKLNSTHFWPMIKNIWSTSCWVIVAFYLYKINYFFSI